MLIASLPALILALALGGRFSRLAEVRLRHLWTIWAALGLQLVLFTPLGRGFTEDQLRVGQLVSYVPIIAFLFLNRRFGLGLLATGVLANFVAIVANRGVMPADPKAQEVIFGAKAVAGQNLNTDSSAEHLAFLGDTMAVPAWLPHANAFSIGDLLIAVGLVWLLARLTLPETPNHGEGVFGRMRASLAHIRTGVSDYIQGRTGAVSAPAVVAAVATSTFGVAITASARHYAGGLLEWGSFGVVAVASIGVLAGVLMAATVVTRYELRATGVVLVLGALGIGMSAVAPVPMTVIGAVSAVGLAFGAAAWWSRERLGHEREALALGLAVGLILGGIAPLTAGLVTAASCLAGLGLVTGAMGLRPSCVVADGAPA